MEQYDNDTEADLEYSDPNLDGEEEEVDLDDDDVVYRIYTSGADFDVGGLVERLEQRTIYRPEFQRNFVWTWRHASRFIESVLLGLPIPSVLLFREEESQKFLIVDGLQRLTTLHAYKTGWLPGSNQKFKLKDVRHSFNNKTLDDLDTEDRRRFENTFIHAMIIQQMAPDDKNSSVFRIFERVNSNGTPLQPQEIRAAIYHGTFQKMLGRTNENSAWRQVFGLEHSRAKDQELILRFLALHYARENYSRPMKNFLNDFMSENRNKTEGELREYENVFFETIERGYSALGKRAFRFSRAMNVAFFDALMVAISENPNATADAISMASRQLEGDQEFLQLISGGTSNETNVIGRIAKAKEVLDAASANCD